MGKKHRVVQSEEEAQRSSIAEQLKAQGNKNFESVYGSKQASSFSVSEDLKAMAEVNIMTQEQPQNNIPDGIEFKPEDSLAGATVRKLEGDQNPKDLPEAKAPEFQEQWMAETEGQISYNEWLDSKKSEEEDKLSEDPVKRTEQISAFIGKTYPNAPSAQMLQQWKQMHGDIFMLNIADRIFIYRYLKRQEWIQMNADPKINEISQLQAEENLFNKCVLWPRLSMIEQASMPANGMGMLVEQIRLQSLFLNAEYVASLTIKI